nr:O-antigen ligase family protein [Pedobacter glucosidilyticus]
MYLITKKTLRDNIHTLSVIFLIVGIIESLIRIWQLSKINYYHSEFSSLSINGSFGNSGLYSNFLALVLPYALSLYLNRDQFNRKITLISSTAIILITFILPFTSGRTSWIAAIGGCFYLIIRYMPKIDFKQLKIKLLFFLSFMFIIIPVGFLMYNYKENSALGRILIYNVQLNIIKDNFLFGIGFGKFEVIYNLYQAEYFISNPNSPYIYLASNITKGFNEFLQIFVELGVIGLILTLLVVLLLFTLKTTEKSVFLTTAKSSFISIIICSCFSYPLRSLAITPAIIFIVSVISSHKPCIKKIDFLLCFKKRILISVFVFLNIILIKVILKTKCAYLDWEKAINLASNKRYSSALLIYDKVYPELKYDGYFLFDYGSTILPINLYKGLEILERSKKYISHNNLYTYLGEAYSLTKNYKKAEYYYSLSSSIVPNRFYPRYRLFKIFINNKQIKKAILIGNQVKNMEIKVESIDVHIMQQEIIEWLKENDN